MKRFSKEEKAAWLEGWQKSGKSAWAYARENGLVPQTFVSWTKANKKEANQAFVEVPKNAPQSTRQILAILIEKGDLRIHIPLEHVSGELKTATAGLGHGL